MKRFFKTMAFTLLGVVLSSNLWAETYAKATSLKAGDNIVLVCEAKSMELTGISTTSTKYGIGTDYETSIAGEYVLEVVAGSETNSFSFKTGSNYLRWNSGNSLDVVATSVAKNSSWLVTFDTDGNATIKNANDEDRVIWWNVSSPRFACYTDKSDGNGYKYVQIYKKEVAPTPAGTAAAPTLPAECKFATTPFDVTITNNESGATVYYTTDGNNPTTTSTSFTGESKKIQLTAATTTVKAMAVIAGKENSSVTSVTYTYVTPLTTMDDIFATSATEGNYYITFNNWVISGVKGNNAYLTDNAGKGLILYKKDHGFVAGDVLSGTVQCALTKYSGSAEITNLTASTDGLTVTKGGTMTAVSTTIADLSGVNTGALINLGDLTYNGSNIFSDGTNTITAYSGIMSSLPTWNSGLVHTVKGIYIQFNNTKEIAPRDENDIVEKQADKFAITIADGIQNGSVSVQGSKTQAAEDESVTLLIAPNTGYKLGTLTVDGSDVTAFVSDNKYTFSMPGYAVNVSATFAAKDVYTITWKVKGQADATTEVVEGETLSLPTAPVYEGYKFVGWTASVIDDKQSFVPTLLANNTTPNADATYYAVFAVVTGQDPMVGNYTLNYDPDVNDKTLGYGSAVNVTAEDGSEWVVKAYKNNGMQINTGQSASIKIPTCPANISTIEITCSAAKAVGLCENDYSGSGTITYLAVGTDAKSQTIDLTEETVTEGYIVAKSGATSITKVVVNYSGTQDHLDNYTTNPTSQVRIHFDLGDGTGTFNDEFVDEGSDYTVTSDEPTPATGYEFVGWLYNEVTYSEGQTISNIQTNITLTAQYKKAWYAVSKATMVNGDITITGLTDDKAEFGATVTLTPAPAIDYAFESIDAYKADDDETKVTLTPAGDNYTFTMPAYAVEVRATFLAAASSCDINFYAAGNTTTPMKTISKKRGEAYEITEVGTAVDGFTFVGWATATQDVEVETPITTVSSVTPEIGSEEDINLYAVYKRAAVEPAYEKVTAEPSSWEGQYLFVYDDKVAMNGGLTELDAVSNTITITVEGGKIVSDATTDAASFTIAAVTDGYSVKSASGNYIYPASFKNSLAQTNTWKASDCTLQITFSDGINKYFQGATQDKTGTMNLRYNKSEGQTRFRFFTNNGQQPISYFKLGEASYVYTTSPVVKYTISYDLNGGTAGEGNFDDQEVVKGETATLTTSIPVAPTGYEFDGWYNGDVKVDATIENVQNDIELVAHYNILSYAVTIPTVDNGTIEVTPLTGDKAEFDAELTITLEPTSADYEVVPNSLKVYETGNESNVVTVSDDNKFNMPAFPVTVVAAFQAVTPNYTIAVQSSDNAKGTVSIYDETETTLSLKEGDERTILAYPEEGYRFVNWTTEDDITITGADEDEATFTVKTSHATITANFEAIPSVIYTKITTTDDLAYNDKVIIVAATADKAMSATQNTNNRGEVAITRGDEGATITLATNDVAVLDVLSGNAVQTFAFHDANGYLYAASSTSNHMKSEDDLDNNGNGNWNVTISEGSATIVAQGTSSRNWMLYNVGSKLFSCYANNTTVNGTNYQYVSLYRIKSDDQVLVTLMNGEEVFARYRANKNSTITLNGFAPDVEGKTVIGWTDGETVYDADAEVTVAEANLMLNVAFEPDFVLENKAAGAYATICLPKKIAKVENATLYNVNYGDKTAIEFVEADFTEDEAGTPYLIQVENAGDVNFFYGDGEATEGLTNRALVGSLSDTDQPIPSDGTAILVSGGQLRIAGTNCVLTKNHAYINVTELEALTPLAPVAGAPRRTIRLYNPDAQMPTNLNAVHSGMQADKIMMNSRIYIIRDGKMFNAQGQLIKK